MKTWEALVDDGLVRWLASLSNCQREAVLVARTHFDSFLKFLGKFGDVKCGVRQIANNTMLNVLELKYRVENRTCTVWKLRPLGPFSSTFCGTFSCRASGQGARISHTGLSKSNSNSNGMKLDLRSEHIQSLW